MGHFRFPDYGCPDGKLYANFLKLKKKSLKSVTFLLLNTLGILLRDIQPEKENNKIFPCSLEENVSTNV